MAPRQPLPHARPAVRKSNYSDPMQGYGQYCPIALAAEVFAERWTPIIIRNLHLGCTGYNEILDGAPDLPRSVLSQRLRALEHAGVVSRLVPTGYRLTESGRELADVV